MTTETEKSPREMAEQIIKHISDAALELAFVRHDLTSDEVDCDDDADVKTRVAAVEEFAERVKEDTLNCLTGEDTGCLDPEELDATNCELIWLTDTVEKALRDRDERAARIADSHYPDDNREGWRVAKLIASAIRGKS